MTRFTDYHQQCLHKNPQGYCGIGGTGVVTVGDRLSLATTSVHLGDHEVEATRG